MPTSSERQYCIDAIAERLAHLLLQCLGFYAFTFHQNLCGKARNFLAPAVDLEAPSRRLIGENVASHLVRWQIVEKGHYGCADAVLLSHLLGDCGNCRPRSRFMTEAQRCGQILCIQALVRYGLRSCASSSNRVTPERLIAEEWYDGCRFRIS